MVYKFIVSSRFREWPSLSIDTQELAECLRSLQPQLLLHRLTKRNSVADRGHFVRIRIRGFDKKNTDPGDPKKTGSDRTPRIRILLRYVYDA